MYRAIVLCCVLASSAALAQESSHPYLDAAVQDANYLATLERPQAHGIAWPAWDGTGAYITTGVDSGAAGIGLFHLRLYQVTGDASYLSKARQAADYVYGEYKAGRNPGYDWLGGVASGGEFFLALYAETRDSVLLEEAVWAGDWLVSNARTDSFGYHWEFTTTPNVYTGLAHGAGGVALFLSRLYQQTGNSVYLQTAEGAIRWMRQFIVPLGESAIGWERLTTDTASYNGWCGGSAGVHFILKKLWEVTNNPEYRDLMLATARGLVAGAQWACPGGGAYDSSTGCPGGAPPLAAWAYNTPASGSYPVIVCHGVSSMVFVLFDAYALTGDPVFRDTAQAGVRWLRAIAQNKPQGQRWEHIYGSGLIESGFLTGAASMGHAFLKMARLDRPAKRVSAERKMRRPTSGDTDYLTEAKAAGDYLLSIADHPRPEVARWITYLDAPQWVLNDPVDFPIRYETGWYTGASGIGIFLLDLHDALHGVVPAADQLSHLSP